MSRADYLLVSELELLRDWGRALRARFGEMPYLVGSALVRRDFRDVDVRIMLDEHRWDALLLLTRQEPRTIHTAMSLWGQKATGLPIDFQFQEEHAANAEFGERPRRPIGMKFAPFAAVQVERVDPVEATEPLVTFREHDDGSVEVEVSVPAWLFPEEGDER